MDVYLPSSSHSDNEYMENLDQLWSLCDLYRAVLLVTLTQHWENKMVQKGLESSTLEAES